MSVTARPMGRAWDVRALLATSGLVGLLAAGLVQPASAQQPPSAAAARQVDFSIPSQDLNAAILAFADAAGIQVFYDAERVKGLRSTAVSGALTAQEALSRLLTGTGFTYRVSGDTVTLERLPLLGAGGEIQLGPVQVEGAGGFGDPGRTEGTGSYTTHATNTSTRLSLSPRETPQTVTVVTRQKIDDFALTSVDDVLRSTSGVYSHPRGSNGPTYYARGFELQTEYDGIPNPIGIGSGNQNPSPDSAFLDRLEVVHGASGLLSGAGEPGGTVNLQRKRPTAEFQAQAEALFGSWDKRRLVGDVSGTLGSELLRGRAVAVWDDSDSFTDYVYEKKHGLYGVIDADLSDTTAVSAAVQYQSNDARITNGVPMGPDGSDLGFSRSTYFGNAQSRHKKQYALYTLKLEQQLPSEWLLTAAYTHATTKLRIRNGNFMVGGPLDPVTGLGISMTQHNTLDRDASSDSMEVYAKGPVELFGRRHEVVVGGSGTYSRDWVWNSGNISTPVNVYSFDPRTLPIPPITDDFPPSDSGRTQHGIYGVARLNVADPLKIIIGSRVSWYRDETDGVTGQEEDAVVSPYMGIVFDISRELSVYASYADIFRPQSQLDRTGGVLDPVVGRNFEAGIKGEFYEGRLNFSAAVFRLEQINLPAIDEDFGNDQANICRGWCYVAQDEVVSQGVDLGLNGEVLPGWQIGGGYTYVNGKYNSGALSGQPYDTQRPDHLLRIHTTYAIPDTGWTVGGNLYVQSRFYNQGVRNAVAWRVEQGSVATLGVMAKYRLNPDTEVSLAANNVLDRRYFASSYGLYYMPFAAPRNFSVALKHHF